MQAEGTELIEESGRVAGVRAKTSDGTIEIRAALTGVGSDGRAFACARAGRFTSNG